MRNSTACENIGSCPAHKGEVPPGLALGLVPRFPPRFLRLGDVEWLVSSCQERKQKWYEFQSGDR